MIVRRIAFLAAALLLVASLSCKKTAEGEAEAWTNNVEKVKELKALHPSFAKPLDEQLAKAEAAMEKARKASEDEAPDEMAAANELLSDGFVGELGKVDRRTKQLRSKLVEASRKADRATVDVLQDDVNRILANVDRLLERGAEDAAAADVVMKKVRTDLASAERNVDRVLRAVRKKERSAKAASSSKKQAKVGKAAPPKPEAKTWACEYCGSMNDAKHLKCASCGAARKK